MSAPVLPHELQVGRFLQSRSKEISFLTEEIVKAGKAGKLASQQVPRHMRRRAVSHHPARLPRRLRPAHNSQKSKSGGDGGTGKRPTRKHRRRPSNLLAEYNRRQMSVGWLETHVWHAKRFHMTRVWGKAVPDTPTDKGWRACYRAASNKCLMWDMSYLMLVEVVGNKSVVMESMNRMTDSRTGSVFSDGPGERTAVVFRPGQFPAGVVGEVSYMWRPQAGGTAEDLLWIWVHPAFYQEFVNLMKEILKLESKENLGEPEMKKIKLNEPSPEKNIVRSKLLPELSPPLA